jgi:manganese transport protein
MNRTQKLSLKRPFTILRGYSRKLGPTWLAAAIAAGPGTMASLLVAGASFGYTLLWVVVLSAVFGALAQYLAMRLGLLSESGIVSLVERRLGAGWAWLLVIDAVLAAGLAQLVIMKGLAEVSATIAGLDARFWGITWAVLIALGLVSGGYRVAEAAAKALVIGVVLAFLASLFVVPLDARQALAGLLPSLPGGVDGALVIAGILGGAVHITLITMQSYTMQERGWTRRDYGLARFDIGSSMLFAFGFYSLAIFLVGASTLHLSGSDAGTLSATRAAQALGPIAGPYAEWLFLLGLWGAALSTLGGNTVVPPYLLADKLGWTVSLSDPRTRVLVVAVALISGVGAFIGGAFLPLLVLVLAFGLVGTVFALVVVLYLLNEPAAEGNSALLNVAGVVLLAVTTFSAGSFVAARVPTAAINPRDALIVAFAAVTALASLVLVVKFILGRSEASA